MSVVGKWSNAFDRSKNNFNPARWESPLWICLCQGIFGLKCEVTEAWKSVNGVSEDSGADAMLPLVWKSVRGLIGDIVKSELAI